MELEFLMRKYPYLRGRYISLLEFMSKFLSRDGRFMKTKLIFLGYNDFKHRFMVEYSIYESSC